MKGMRALLAITQTFTINGIEAVPVQVECDITTGLPGFEIVGLASMAVKEARDRVRAAIKNCGFDFPNRKIIINLAPADLRKEGSHFDLAMAIGIMLASGQIEAGESESFFMAGELSLNGQLREVPGILPMALELGERHLENGFIIPRNNRDEAAIAGEIGVYPFSHLEEVVKFLNGEIRVERYESPERVQPIPDGESLDYADVKGQESAKRGLQIAAAGLHNILMIGPPGGGKTMLARRMPSIFPDMNRQEILETTRVYSTAGLLNPDCPVIRERPFRAPHKNASSASIIGGGKIPRPGEISLAQNGVLFMDELPEFGRDVLEALRQPLEDQTVSIARSQATFSFPAKFCLCASLNPCPCGHYGSDFDCRCSPMQIQKYLNRISGPLLDRIDLQVEVPRVHFESLSDRRPGNSSQQMKEGILRAREIQARRYAKFKIKLNSEMRPADIRKFCRLEPEGEDLLKSAFQRLKMSARAYDRILKMARTIADIEASEQLGVAHISEAIQYRSLDRKYWNHH